MLRLNFLDITILIAFLATCLVIGIVKSVQIKTLKEFALGYKNISLTALVCSMFAASTGAGSTIGVTGKIYEFGTIFVIRQLLEPLFWLVAAFVIAPNITRFKGCVSLGEIMYKLYGAPGRCITAFVSIIRSLGIIAAQAVAMGSVFYFFLGIDPNYGILIGYSIITVYAALGGIRAVIYTEIFKSNIFLFIIPISYIVVFTNTGGIESFFQSLPESHLNIKMSDHTLSLLTSFALYTLLPGFYPGFVQRCLIAQHPGKLKRALKMTALISLPVSAAFCVIAYKMKANYPDIVPNEALLYFIAILPEGLRGLMVTGLIAIIMSMAESEINATSIILVNDIIKVLYRNINNTLELVAIRSVTIILSISSIVLIHSATNILNLVWSIANFWGPIISIPALCGFLGFKTNSSSFVASVITAMIFTIIGRFIAGEFAIISWSFGILGSTTGLFSMHYYQIYIGKLPLKIQPPTEKVAILVINKTLDLFKEVAKFINSTIRLIKENPGHRNFEIKKFCTFTLSYYFLYSLDVTSNPDHQVVAWLLISGYFFCMIMLSREFIFSKKFLNNYLHYYWYFLLTFCLPFVSNYMLFVSNGDDFWIMNGILSAFALYLFVDARRFLLMYTVGLICGIFLFSKTGHNINSFKEITTASSIAYIYLFFLFATLFFFRKREKEQEERVETMHVFGGAMAHEVKSPLATLNMCAVTINNLFQGAFDNKKVKDNTYTFTLDKEEGDTLLEFTQMLTKVSSQGISTVDGLLASLKSTVIADDKKNITIEECVTASILEYKLLNPEKDGVNINIVENFLFYGSMHYIKRLLSNLLNNAYKYGGRNVKIEIRAESNKLYFRDNGKGISEDDIPYIFDKFYTKSKSGTGIGLAFCKMIMHDMGGYIECKSRIGKYTEFILTFPALKKKKKKKVVKK
ncbi:hypothetical protein NF27_DT00120 [Candidatus Jidaibacter acanthamoeba]|uniref:histidine kinase n=1 Tax=Candidatus Jidaibacter acanthamoebae TaxID=86105 RepID=A0A0C1QMH7_9RICK|nr:ATP-binding protein [Candidatus Jidaibacter acanthamoeba]KIE05238.1 hypothetical protein NF27_DT00120 [Candidatus Jidaibacter acanthamoeba]